MHWVGQGAGGGGRLNLRRSMPGLPTMRNVRNNKRMREGEGGKETEGEERGENRESM